MKYLSIIANTKPFEVKVNGDYLSIIHGETHYYVIGTIIEIELLEELWKTHRENIGNYLNGNYVLAIVEKYNIYVIVDMFGGVLPVYYTKNNDTFYVSTSIKTILEESNIKRKLNKIAALSFIKHGAIFSSDTLVKNCKKIGKTSILQINQKGISLLKVNYRFDQIDKEKAIDIWDDTLEKAIMKRIECKNCVFPLSSGFDSNLIFSYAKTQRGVLDAYSVGGRYGKNELEKVERIVNLYGDVKLHKTYVDHETLNSLPDIVWRLEGSVYDIGVFLQYELGKAINKEQDTRFAVCGEGADEVFHSGFVKSISKEVKRNNHGSIHTWLSLYVLKKSAVLLNSFGIECSYPYTDKDVIAIANALQYLNADKKKFHKERCKGVIRADVMCEISTTGGATDYTTLFNGGDITEDDLKLFIKKKKEYWISFKSIMLLRSMYIILQGIKAKLAGKSIIIKARLEKEKRGLLMQTLYCYIFEQQFIKESIIGGKVKLIDIIKK